MEEAGLDATGGKQLAYVFQSIDRVLYGLAGETVHQVGVYQDSGVAEGPCHPCHLINRDAFFHQRQQAVGGDFQTAGNRDAAARGELLADFRRKGFLEADIAPPRDHPLPRLEFRRHGAQSFGRGGLIDEMKAAAASFSADALHPVHQLAGIDGFEAGDVIEADVAEAAFLPVAPMGDSEFVPAPVGPQAVHGVEQVEQGQVAIQG